MRRNDGQYSLFRKLAVYIGGACAIVALAMNSVIPLVVGGFALFCTLNYMNGLGARPAY